MAYQQGQVLDSSGNIVTAGSWGKKTAYGDIVNIIAENEKALIDKIVNTGGDSIMQIVTYANLISNLNNVISRINSPPSNPLECDSYLVIAAATGAWLGQENMIAFFFDGSWNFIAPTAGYKIYVKNENKYYIWGS